MNEISNSYSNGGICEGYSEVLELIHEIDKKFEKLQRQEITKDDLTTSQFFILRQLWESDGLQFKDLAVACNCSRSTITGVVDTMEKKGLVKRAPHPNDRRGALVKLTKKGKSLKESTPSIDSLTSNCCEGIDANDLTMLKILLQRLSNSLTIC
jgi:DNA-binding MarR family transcriptional regulator